MGHLEILLSRCSSILSSQILLLIFTSDLQQVNLEMVVVVPLHLQETNVEVELTKEVSGFECFEFKLK